MFDEETALLMLKGLDPFLRSEIFERKNEKSYLLPFGQSGCNWHWYLKDTSSVHCACLLAMINCDDNVVTNIGRIPDASIANNEHRKPSPLQ